MTRSRNPSPALRRRLGGSISMHVDEHGKRSWHVHARHLSDGDLAQLGVLIEVESRRPFAHVAG